MSSRIANRALRGSVLSAALAVALVGGAQAQTNTTGNVTGRAAPGATIVAESTATGIRREVLVGEDGNYRLTQLPPGSYRIEQRRADGGSDVRENVVVSVGTGTNVAFVETSVMQGIDVIGTSVSPIDVSSVESSTILTEAILDQIPVPRSVTAVALLAPGTTLGDSAFGNLASFGGASVAENAYYINGFNVTNFRNGLGGSTVPFEFYREFQVKTGGYSAEFGRSTGGVINAITKRGGNEFEAGANVYWVPGSLRENAPCVFDNDGVQIGFACEGDFNSSTEANAYLSGPLIKDRLFFFVLYNGRDFSQTQQVGGRTTGTLNEDPFWGTKLDWYITDDHLLEYTGFSDRAYIREVLDVGVTEYRRGGRNHIFKYTGHLTDSFTVSAMYGKGDYDRSDVGEGDDCPAIIDLRTPQRVDLGCWTNLLPGTSFDSREAKRVDFEWDLGDFVYGRHLLRFGWDKEDNLSTDNQFYSGGVYYLYQTVGGMPRARERFYFNGGGFATISQAFYLEDNWNVTDDVLISLGLRNEQFDNRNANDETFAKITNQWAPRLGASWNVKGDGTQKLFANYGRYHLPVASNTNIRLAGSELFTQQFFELLDINPDGTPQLGPALGPVTVFGDGTIPDPREIVDQNLKPMYQDEFFVGFQQDFGNGWTGGVRGIWRELKSTIEDVAIDAALNTYAAANGFDDFSAGGFDYYVLTNPGSDMRIFVDLNGDGTLEEVNLSATELGYPRSERKYRAIELFFERTWASDWFLQGSYTWSKSYGNNEGYVRSDNGQTDAGLTTLFDQPGLTDGTYGYLPNDRRHQIKVFGAWQFADDWQLSGNFNWRTGRPISCFGNHPTDQFAAAYGSESLYCGGVLVPRGSLGRTSSIYQVDLGLQYRPEWADNRLTFKLDIVNALNRKGVTEVSELGEDDNAPSSFPRSRFLTPAAFQQARYVRVGISYDW